MLGCETGLLAVSIITKGERVPARPDPTNPSAAYRLNRHFVLGSIVERQGWAVAHASPQRYQIITTDA
jgi:hypothetical protein